MNKIIALGLASMLAASSQAASATTTITYAGTVADRQGSGNQDQYFGNVVAGTSTYTLVYTIGDGGTTTMPDAYSVTRAGTGSVTAKLTINGVSQSVGGTFESFATAANGQPNTLGVATDAVSQRSRDFMSGTIYRDVYASTFVSSYLGDFLSSADVTAPFVYQPVSGDSVLNNFHINDFDGQTRVGSSIYLSLGVSSVTVANVVAPAIDSAVPEPETWAMMIGGLGMVCAAMRRRSARVRFA